MVVWGGSEILVATLVRKHEVAGMVCMLWIVISM